MTLTTRMLRPLIKISISIPKCKLQPCLLARNVHTAPTNGHGMLSPPRHPHPHAPKLPSDSYMYETFAAVIMGTCGFLGYLLLSQEKDIDKGIGKRNKLSNRKKWTGTVDGEPELEELCYELMEVE